MHNKLLVFLAVVFLANPSLAQDDDFLTRARDFVYAYRVPIAATVAVIGLTFLGVPRLREYWKRRKENAGGAEFGAAVIASEEAEHKPGQAMPDDPVVKSQWPAQEIDAIERTTDPSSTTGATRAITTEEEDDAGESFAPDLGGSVDGIIQRWVQQYFVGNADIWQLGAEAESSFDRESSDRVAEFLNAMFDFFGHIHYGGGSIGSVSIYESETVNGETGRRLNAKILEFFYTIIKAALKTHKGKLVLEGEKVKDVIKHLSEPGTVKLAWFKLKSALDARSPIRRPKTFQTYTRKLSDSVCKTLFELRESSPLSNDDRLEVFHWLLSTESMSEASVEFVNDYFASFSSLDDRFALLMGLDENRTHGLAKQLQGQALDKLWDALRNTNSQYQLGNLVWAQNRIFWTLTSLNEEQIEISMSNRNFFLCLGSDPISSSVALSAEKLVKLVQVFMNGQLSAINLPDVRRTLQKLFIKMDSNDPQLKEKLRALLDSNCNLKILERSLERQMGYLWAQLLTEEEKAKKGFVDALKQTIAEAFKRGNLEVEVRSDFKDKK